MIPLCYGIIPARYDSTRFPGKPLAVILGKPMFWHVFHQASQCRQLHQVVVATDDERIAQKAQELHVPVCMTCKDHASGTDRVFEAAKQLHIPDDAVVVNIQGDEPALHPDVISELLSPFSNPDIHVTTPAIRMDWADASNPDRVKVVFDTSQRALYFSRACIPYDRERSAEKPADVFGHIGLYAFRMHVLQRFVSMKPTPLETREKLEQLRLLENGIPIHIVQTRHKSIGVDHPCDIEPVTEIIKRFQSVFEPSLQAL
jgi:3-deoxy-manno-octulosonate cytidylyltransferase (CMP-KDO synthetase)